MYVVSCTIVQTIVSTQLVTQYYSMTCNVIMNGSEKRRGITFRIHSSYQKDNHLLGYKRCRVIKQCVSLLPKPVIIADTPWHFSIYIMTREVVTSRNRCVIKTCRFVFIDEQN